jgi:hypothetical protein
VMLIPFVLSQARIAFFPQLGTASYGGWHRPFINQESGAPLPADNASVSVTGRRKSAYEAADRPTESSLELPSADRASPLPPGITELSGLSAQRPVASPVILPRYALGSVLQAGPGVPRWNFGMHPLAWSGPVEPAQSVRLVVLGPLAVSAWRLAACVLLVLLLVLLVRESFDHPRWVIVERWLPRRKAAAPLATGLLAIAIGVALPQPAPAEATPAPEILEQLRQRLQAPPPCAPACISIATATVRANDDEMLEIELEAHAQTRSALALPGATRYWEVESVRIDGSETVSLSRDAAGRVLLGIEPGVRTVTMRGRLAAADSVRIAFPERPARIRVDTPQWVVTGTEDGRLLADSITLARRAVPVAAVPGAAQVKRLVDEFPPYAHVTRRLSLGLDGWSASTAVDRMAPASGAFTLDVPLLPGESILTANVPVHDGAASVSMPADAGTVRWNSTLAVTAKLRLQAPTDAPWSETWQIDPSPVWRVTFDGTPEVFADPAQVTSALHHFEPRPGEKLTLRITRPPPVPGSSVAFDAAQYSVTVGQRARDVDLQIDYRSTQGGRHELQLPKAARLTSVTADGQPLSLRAEQGSLVVPLQPGAHQLRIVWQSDRAPEFITSPEPVLLRAPVSNVDTKIAVPETRWILFAGGGGVGPAVLYWAELIVFIVLALALGRFAPSPLTTRDWLLVGLGLSTFSWSVLLLFAAWVFAMQWRRRWQTPVAPWSFNLVQVALAVLTVIALGSLVAAIPNGLLGTPDMRIAGHGNSSHELAWFHDRVQGALPQPVVVSVSIWFYKAAMLAWALWLSFALVRWVRTAWDSFTSGRVWYSARPVEAAVTPPILEN